MKCPVCTAVNLVMSERQGIEIDYCPECRGVWLDRGELDKIIERSGSQSAEQQPVGMETYPRPTEQPAYRTNSEQTFHHGHRGHGYGHEQHYKKKKSLLSELFDFD
jgi:Zn-finger nucleic acid-binding protein